MNVENYIKEKNDLLDIILEFLETETSSADEYQDLTEFCSNRNELSLFLHLISKISKNHKRNPNFFNKIEKLILFFEEEIKKQFSNTELFRFFKKSKRILLFLLNKKMLNIDETIIKYIFKKSRKEKAKLSYFFHKEIQPFLTIERFRKRYRILKKQISRIEPTTLENFEEKRQIGENDSYICSLIRNDSVIEFIAYVNKNNISLSNNIKQSIYETNSFLLKNKETSIIEYAAFFGSIQIFRFLLFNNVELKPSLWLYAIHGKNGELIHLLEENKIEPKDKTYKECFKEAIKCHHNDIANYIKNNLMKETKDKFDKNENAFAFHYYNFDFLQVNINHKSFFYYACKYDYITIVDILLKENKINLNDTIVFLLIYTKLNIISILQYFTYYDFNGVF